MVGSAPKHSLAHPTVAPFNENQSIQDDSYRCFSPNSVIDISLSMIKRYNGHGFRSICHLKIYYWTKIQFRVLFTELPE
jgi:hypothetical protein